MTLVLETGTGITGANAYADRTFADPFLAARGHAAWAAATETARDQALIRASAYIDHAFSFIGRRAGPDQPLAWPRIAAEDGDGYPVTGVPNPVRQATALLALRALDGDLAGEQERGGRIRRERIGDAIEIEYEPDAPPGVVHPDIVQILRPLSRSGGAGRTVRR